MVNDIAVQEFVNAIKETPQDTNKTYNATVSRVDDEGVVWVNIHGSEKETPTASTSTEVKRGDAVTVNWRNNKLYIGGNYSNPSAGVVRVASVEQNAEDARLAAEAAEYNARLAQSLAEQNAITMANTVIEINNDIADLQNQIDGNITTWFYDYQPTTSNAPASTWTTVDEKNNHLGDLFYDTSTGYAYRWMSNGASTPTFSWSKITDTDVTTALATALAAQDTADHKRRVFITTPTVPYDVGDLWCEGTTGDILTCTHARTEAQSYSASDWSKLNKYTDDTRADEAYTLANTAKVSADGKNKIYRQATQPSDGTYVVGDIWFDTSHSNKIYRYSGSAWVAVTLGDDALDSLSANKLTAGTIDASIITVSNLDAGNITTGNLAADRMKVNSISAINSNTGTVKIAASKVEIDGTATFNAIKSSADAAYDAKGAASDVQTALQTEIDAKKSIHTLTSSVTAGKPYATILGYAAEGTVTTFSVVTATGVKVGDTVRLAYLANDMGTGGTTVYIVGEVTAVNPNSVTLKAHGLDTTVIDGGHILTGTLDASKVNVSNLTVGAFGEGELSVGGTNYLPNTALMATWDKGSATTISNGVASLTGSSSNWNGFVKAGKMSTDVFDGSTPYIWSFEYMTTADCSVVLTVDGTAGTVSDNNWARARYYQFGAAKTFPNTNGKWVKYEMNSRTYSVSDLTTVVTSDAINSVFFTLFNRTSTGAVFNVRHMQFEKGKVSTSWQPAPDDMSAEATKYITAIDSNGIRIHPSSTQNNSAVINADGLEIFKGGTSVAMYGDTARVGKLSKPHILIKDGGIELWYSSEATLPLANFGYGSAISGTGGTELGSFFSFGGRVADSLVGNFSVAEGFVNTASGYSSHAQGTTNTASGYASYAQGDTNTASGSCAHAEGYYTTASGNNSHASGNHTIAAGAEQTAIGRYNVQDTTSLFIIGKGTMAGRANAFSVGSDGKVYVNGSTVHSSDRRLKQHLNYLDDSADEFIRKLRPAHYIKDDEHHTGFYAQDVAEADKWDCMTGEDSSGYMTLSYMEIIAPLVAYCQHLEKRIEELERG